MKRPRTHPAIPNRQRLAQAYPRAGRTVLPAQARPNLFGSD